MGSSWGCFLPPPCPLPPEDHGNRPAPFISCFPVSPLPEGKCRSWHIHCTSNRFQKRDLKDDGDVHERGKERGEGKTVRTIPGQEALRGGDQAVRKDQEARPRGGASFPRGHAHEGWARFWGPELWPPQERGRELCRAAVQGRSRPAAASASCCSTVTLAHSSGRHTKVTLA